MQRRRLLASLATAGGVLLLSGHSPYRQWKLYRQSHLLLFTTRDDTRSDELGEALAARLREAGMRFVIEPHLRFRGQPGEQATMFLLDPSGNALEFKAFKDIAKQLFAK
jgi:hypothetical protein